MTNAAERVLDAESAANALVAELERLKSAAEAMETAHADSEQARRATQDVVTTLKDVMPAVARVNKQLQALDLPALVERLTGEITASGTELTQQLAGEIRAVTEPVNQAVGRLESLPAEVAAVQEAQARVEPTIEGLDSKAAALLQQAAAAAEQHARASAQVQTSLAGLESLPAEVAAVQETQARVEPAIRELDGKAASLLQQAAAAAEQHARASAQVQTSLAGLEALPAEIAAVQEAQGRVEPALRELDGKAASLLQQAAAAAEHHERSSTQVQTSLAGLEALPAEVAAVQETQARVEPAIRELDGKAASLLQQAAAAAEHHERSSTQVQTSLAGLESLPAEVAAVQETQARVEPAIRGVGR